MTKIVKRIGGDYYKIKVDDGGEIWFDVGPSSTSPGSAVKITGDLIVEGTLSAGSTTEVDREDLVIFDNTITLNRGETGAGIQDGSGSAGIVIDRGTLNDVNLFFDETKNSIRNEQSIQGSFVFQDNTQAPLGIHASSISTLNNDNLYLLNNASVGIVTVKEASNYEKSVFNYDINDDIEFNASSEDKLEPIGEQINQSGKSYDEDALITARLLIDYTRSYHKYNFQDRIISADNTPSSVVANTDTVVISVNGDANNVVTFSEFDAVLYGLNVKTESNITPDDVLVRPISTNSNLILRGNNLGIVQNDDYLNLTKQADPTEIGNIGAPADGVTIYGDTLADGGTGLYFINEDGTNDEIASRNKALLFSIIF